MKNEYYSNNNVLKRTSKNNIIPHIWVFFCKFWKIFILLLPYFTIFLYFHLFISKHFETYLCTIRIIFVFVFVFVVILKTNIIRICIRLILKSEYYSYSYSFDFEKRILFVFVFGWFWKTNIIRIRIRSKIIIRLITDFHSQRIDIKQKWSNITHFTGSYKCSVSFYLISDLHLC